MHINEISGLTAQESQHHDTCDTNPVLINKNETLNRQNKKNMGGKNNTNEVMGPKHLTLKNISKLIKIVTR